MDISLQTVERIVEQGKYESCQDALRHIVLSHFGTGEKAGAAYSLVSALLRLENLDVNFVDSENRTLIALLLRQCPDWNELQMRCARDVLYLLLRAGGDPNIKASDGWTPLLLLLRYGFEGPTSGDTIVEMCFILITYGADLNATIESFTAFMLLAYYAFGRDECVQPASRLAHVFVQRCSNLNMCHDRGENVLHILGKRGFRTKETAFHSATTMSALIARGVNPNATTRDGDSVLMHLFEGAVMTQEIATTVLRVTGTLIEAGADPKIISAKGCYAMTLLFERGFRGAIGACDAMEKVVRLLLDNGADPNIGYEDGWTPLLYTVRSAFLRPDTIPVAMRISEMLLDHGADIEACTEYELTCLHLIARYGFENGREVARYALEWLDLFLNRGANPNRANTEGRTAFMLICTHGFQQADTVEPARQAFSKLLKLVNTNGHVDDEDEDGWRALTLLLLHGFDIPEASRVTKFLVEDLLECGADCWSSRDPEVSPLAIIAEYDGQGEATIEMWQDRLHVIKIFLTHGASPDIDEGIQTDETVRTLLDSWPKVVTLRTLCLRNIDRNFVQWEGVVPKKLVEFPDEIEEQREASHQQQKGEEYIRERDARAEAVKKCERDRELMAKWEAEEQAKKRGEEDLTYNQFLDQGTLRNLAPTQEEKPEGVEDGEGERKGGERGRKRSNGTLRTSKSKRRR